MTPLSKTPLNQSVRLRTIQGERSFRRRLMELGFVPGTAIEVVNVAPMGDPLELKVRNAWLSIRRREADQLMVD